MNIDLSKYETITSHGYPSGVYRLGKYSSVWLEVEGTNDDSDIYDVYALSVFSGGVVGRYWLGNAWPNSEARWLCRKLASVIIGEYDPILRGDRKSVV